MSMELRQLRYFLAVAKHLNFTYAATEVHIAQPPLSRQISNLENELGVKLLERSQRGLKLTAAGVFLVERASEILERVERTKNDAAAFNTKSKRPFKIGFDSALLYGRTPRVFRFLRGRYSQYDFQFAEVPSGDQARALRNGQVEFTLGRTAVNDDQIEQITIREDPFLVALETHHPAYSSADQKIRLAEIKSETLILYGERTASISRDPVLRFLDHAQVKFADTIWISDLSGALGLVAAGLGVSIVPSAAVLMRGQDVCYVAIADKGAVCPVVLSTLNGNHAEIIEAILVETKRLRKADGFRID
jgi:DNA-binding transcriptional LysR family regulator